MQNYDDDRREMMRRSDDNNDDRHEMMMNAKLWLMIDTKCKMIDTKWL